MKSAKYDSSDSLDAPTTPHSSLGAIFGFLFSITFVAVIGVLFIAFAVLLGKYELITLVFALLLASTIRSFLSDQQRVALEEVPIIGEAAKIFNRLELHYREHQPRSLWFYLLFPLTGIFSFVLSKDIGRKELRAYADLMKWIFALLVIEGAASYFRLYRHLDLSFALDWLYLELLTIYFLCNFFAIPLTTMSMRLSIRDKRTQLFSTSFVSIIILAAITFGFAWSSRFDNQIPIQVVLDKRIEDLKTKVTTGQLRARGWIDTKSSRRATSAPWLSSLGKKNKEDLWMMKVLDKTQMYLRHHCPRILKFNQSTAQEPTSHKHLQFFQRLNKGYQVHLAGLAEINENEQFFMTANRHPSDVWGVMLVPFRESVFYVFHCKQDRVRLFLKWTALSHAQRRKLRSHWDSSRYVFSSNKRMAQLIVRKMQEVARERREVARRKKAEREAKRRAQQKANVLPPTVKSQASKERKKAKGLDDTPRAKSKDLSAARDSKAGAAPPGAAPKGTRNRRERVKSDRLNNRADPSQRRPPSDSDGSKKSGFFRGSGARQSAAKEMYRVRRGRGSRAARPAPPSAPSPAPSIARLKPSAPSRSAGEGAPKTHGQRLRRDKKVRPAKKSRLAPRRRMRSKRLRRRRLRPRKRRVKARNTRQRRLVSKTWKRTREQTRTLVRELSRLRKQLVRARAHSLLTWRRFRAKVNRVIASKINTPAPAPHPQLFQHPLFARLPNSAGLRQEIQAYPKLAQKAAQFLALLQRQTQELRKMQSEHDQLTIRWLWLHDTKDPYTKKLWKQLKAHKVKLEKSWKVAKTALAKSNPNSLGQRLRLLVNKHAQVGVLLARASRALRGLTKIDPARSKFVLYSYRLVQFDYPRALSVKLLYDHFGIGPRLRTSWWTVFYEYLLSIMLFLFALSMPLHLALIFYCRWKLGGLTQPDSTAHAAQPGALPMRQGSPAQ